MVRLTGRNHWPAKRETPADWKGVKSIEKKYRVCTARGRKLKEEKKLKQPGFARVVLVNQACVWTMNVLNFIIPSLTSSNREIDALRMFIRTLT